MHSNIKCAVVLLGMASGMLWGWDQGLLAQSQDADSILPITSEIRSEPDVLLQWKGGKTRLTKLEYFQVKDTLIPFPVWVVFGPPSLTVERSGTSLQERVCSPGEPLLKSDEVPKYLHFNISNLLNNQETRPAIWDHLRKLGSGADAQKLRFADLQTDDSNYTVTLYHADQDQALSLPTRLSKVVVARGDKVSLALLPAAWKEVEDPKTPLTLSRTYLQVDGTFRARFEQTQVEFHWNLVRNAILDLQHRLGSRNTEGGQAPVALYHVPLNATGVAEQSTAMDSSLGQFLSGTIRIRKGEKVDSLLILRLAEKSLDQISEPLRIMDQRDSETVALLLGNLATLSATVGDIKSLATQTRKEREAALNEALETSAAGQQHAQQNKAVLDKTAFHGKLDLRVDMPIPIPFLKPIVGPKVEAGGELQRGVQEQNENSAQHQAHRKALLNSLQRGLDDVASHFQGRIPTLTGLRFEQHLSTKIKANIDVEFKQHTFTVGWSQHQWPLIFWEDSLPLTAAPDLLAEQLQLSQARYQRFVLLLESANALEARQQTLTKDHEALIERQQALLDSLDVKEAQTQIRALQAAQAELKSQHATLQAEAKKVREQASILEQGLTLLDKAKQWESRIDDLEKSSQQRVKDLADSVNQVKEEVLKQFPDKAKQWETRIDELERSSQKRAKDLADSVNQVKEEILKKFPAAPGGQATYINKLGMKFVYIAPGEFMMGSPETEMERHSDETLHKVRLTKGFYLGVYEVTQGEYRRITGSNPSYFSRIGLGREQVKDLEESRLPVECVTWDDAVKFCRLLSTQDERTYRLPTEAEWEYACRAGTMTPFSYGDTCNASQANCDGTGRYGNSELGVFRNRTNAVGSFPPNSWGLYDMHGNVAEWCQDSYKSFSSEPATDPLDILDESDRIARGGNWYLYPKDCRSAMRAASRRHHSTARTGFRVVLEPLPE